MLQISWPALAAILTLVPLAGGLFSRALAMRFRAELAEFRNALMDDLSDRYMPRIDAERRFETLAGELKETRHDLRNELHKLNAQVELMRWGHGGEK